MQIDKSLEEAATLVGAGFWTKFKRIIYPLTKSGFVSGFLLSFISTMRELSLIVLIVTPANKVLTTMIFQIHRGRIPSVRRRHNHASGSNEYGRYNPD